MPKLIYIDIYYVFNVKNCPKCGAFGGRKWFDSKHLSSYTRVRISRDSRDTTISFKPHPISHTRVPYRCCRVSLPRIERVTFPVINGLRQRREQNERVYPSEMELRRIKKNRYFQFC